MTDEVPPDFRQLDAALRSVRFEPRASLEPEVAGRLRQGEPLKGVVLPGRGRLALWFLAGLAAAFALVVVETVRWRFSVTVDRCCFDFDGGGGSDDGVVVVAGRDEQVRRLAIYEDRDHSRSYTPGDVLRFVRGSDPARFDEAPGRLITTRFCCADYDGGGPADDGLVVVGVPPDRVTMVAMYQQPKPGLNGPSYRLR